MDSVNSDASYSQQNTSDDIVDSVDYVYSSEGSEDENVVSKNEVFSQVVLTFSEGPDDGKIMSNYETVPHEAGTSSEGPEDEKLLANREIVPQEEGTSGVPKRSVSWTMLETFILLEAWGERLLRNSRRSVQSAEWEEVAEKVSEVSKSQRTRSHCRNRLDTLKRLYKKETAKLADNADYASHWVYFSKMDSIVSSSLNQRNGKQIVTDEVHPSHNNSSDEMRKGLVGDPDFARIESDNLQNLRTRKKRKMAKEDNLEDTKLKKRRVRKAKGRRNSYKLIAACVNKFCEIYERVERSRITQMFELEKMRMNFRREMELERMKTLTTWEAEMAKIRRFNIDDDE